MLYKSGLVCDPNVLGWIPVAYIRFKNYTRGAYALILVSEIGNKKGLK